MKGILRLMLCMLVTFCLATPVLATTKTNTPAPTGTILYVGGSGPGNYTSIQDALDHATDGDTIYVYHDGSPYLGNFTITHSIILMGEDRDTTIIDAGHGAVPILLVRADGVTIQGFTIRNTQFDGILIRANDTLVNHTRITDCSAGGITVVPWTYEPVSRNIISNNIISNCQTGIGVWTSDKTRIEHNDITMNTTSPIDLSGIHLSSSFNSLVTLNHVRSAHNGLFSEADANNTIYQNEFTDCLIGVSLQNAYDSTIKNNFINNTHPATFTRNPFLNILYRITVIVFKRTDYFSINQNPLNVATWQSNYWGQSYTKPYPIPGWRGYYNQIAGHHATRVMFDFSPAAEPYDIPPVE